MNKPPVCSCQAAGFCTRHGFDKTANLYRICQHDDEQRAHWDKIAATGRSLEGSAGPGIGTKAVNFTAATFRHYFGGMPTRSLEDIATRYEICTTCPAYNGTGCSDCGCFVSLREFLSKVGWRGERCPRDRWPEE